MNKHSFWTRRNITFIYCLILASELVGWIRVNIAHLTAVGLWLQRGPKCMLCKANTIPPWVGTAGVSACGHVTHRSSGCWNPHLSPKVHQPQSVGGTEMTQPPGSLMGRGIGNRWRSTEELQGKVYINNIEERETGYWEKKKDWETREEMICTEWPPADSEM